MDFQKIIGIISFAALFFKRLRERQPAFCLFFVNDDKTFPVFLKNTLNKFAILIYF